ncbi:hypothetical protein LINPERHAP2_LOCUS37261, partial [Linum perenne]
MNPDVVDIGSSSFIPSEFVPVVPEKVSSGFMFARLLCFILVA